ncbi:MAG: hypothetical protein HQL73_14095 [Magnetococcales bacterium]|nr:hypothetical protein [Magnetococcales bacterium]
MFGNRRWAAAGWFLRKNTGMDGALSNSSARTLLEALCHQGLFLDDRLLEGMLVELGE